VRTSDSRYGSEKAGLLCGYLFAPGHPGREIEADEACDALAAQQSGSDAFLWLHFNLANQAAQRWLQQRLALPEAFHTSLHHAKSTRVEMVDESVVAVINDVTLFGLDASTVSAMTLCVDTRMLVSARHTPLRSIDRLRESVQAGERFRSAVELLAHLLRDQADMLVHLVREATEHVDRLEDGLMANRVASSRAKLGALRRVLVRLQRLLAPEPSALFRLLNRPPKWICTSDVEDLRQSAEELAAAVADCVALVERVRLLQEEIVAVVNEQTSRTLFVLTVVTVLALPMTIIPGLFGMNVGGVPLRDSGAGFWILVVLMTGMVAIGALMAFKRRRDS
jgi:zinc transporter